MGQPVTDKGYKCVYCPNCPYYERPSSYGIERIKCANTNCIHYEADYTEVQDDT